MESPYLLGVDLGTSSVKTIIINREGRIISSGSQEYSLKTPQSGWAEQDPEIWFQAVIYTIQTTLHMGKIPPEKISGIGITGLMHGPVFLDSHFQSIRPSILWADKRASRQVDMVNEVIGRKNFGRMTGNPPATGFMLVTLLWLLENEPNTLKNTSYLLLPKDYIRYRLTGEIGTEESDASATLLFDQSTRNWNYDLIEQLGIIFNNKNQIPLPYINPSHQIAGSILPEIAELTGLTPGTPVVFGGSDQACQAIGNGIIEPGMVSCTIGTGGQIFSVTNKPIYDPDLRLHLFCHAVPKKWHLLAATLTAGKSLRWLRDNFFEGTTIFSRGTHPTYGA